MAKGSVTLAGHFPPGTKVEIYERVSDIADRDIQGKAVKSKKATQNADVEFTDLDADKPYWIVGEIEGAGEKSVRVVAKPDNPQAARRSEETDQKSAGQPARVVSDDPPPAQVVHGARSSVSSRARSKK